MVDIFLFWVNNSIFSFFLIFVNSAEAIIGPPVIGSKISPFLSSHFTWFMWKFSWYTETNQVPTQKSLGSYKQPSYNPYLLNWGVHGRMNFQHNKLRMKEKLWKEGKGGKTISLLCHEYSLFGKTYYLQMLLHM